MRKSLEAIGQHPDTIVIDLSVCNNSKPRAGVGLTCSREGGPGTRSPSSAFQTNGDRVHLPDCKLAKVSLLPEVYGFVLPCIDFN